MFWSVRHANPLTATAAVNYKEYGHENSGYVSLIGRIKWG